MLKIKTNSDLIARYDNVLPDNICDDIVQYMKDSLPDKPNIGNLPWHQNDNIAFANVTDKYLRGIIDSYRFLFTQLVGSHYNTIVYPHFSDLVTWREGMYMDFHKDDGYEEDNSLNLLRVRTYSMVTYLNDDYIGGQTIVRFKDGSEYISSPKKGSVLLFKSNDECEHKVNRILNGTRYTLATWFATEISECECVDFY